LRRYPFLGRIDRISNTGKAFLKSRRSIFIGRIAAAAGLSGLPKGVFRHGMAVLFLRPPFMAALVEELDLSDNPAASLPSPAWFRELPKGRYF
jgi:hypothetical protein